MSFTDTWRDRQIEVDGKPVYVPENTTGNEILSAANRDPNTRDLVLANADGTTAFINKPNRITVNGGERFETQTSAIGGR